MRRILLLGSHGQKNWGDELLLDVFTRELGAVADRFYVNSHDPAATARFLRGRPVETFPTNGQRHRLLAYLRRCDAVVFAGGSVVKELYPAHGGSRFGTLNAVDVLTLAAAFLRKPIHFGNIGVGPLETARGAAMARRILARGRSTTVRDSESSRLLASTDVAWERTTDAVFAVDRSCLGLPAGPAGAGGAAVRTVGLNLCRNIGNNANWAYFTHRLAHDLAGWVTEHPGTAIVGIPMQYDVDNNNDHAELVAFRERLRELVPAVPFEIVKPASIPELARAVDRVDVLVAERLHALVLAMVTGTPLVALEYDIKVTGMVNDTGLGGYGIKINERFAPGLLTAVLRGIADDHARARREVARAYAAHHRIAVGSLESLRAALAPPSGAAPLVSARAGSR